MIIKILQKHKNKIITTVIIIALLTGAWFIGGGNIYANKRGNEAPPQTAAQEMETLASSGNTNTPANESSGDNRVLQSGNSGELQTGQSVLTEESSIIPTMTDGSQEIQHFKDLPPSLTEISIAIDPAENLPGTAKASAENSSETAEVSADSSPIVVEMPSPLMEASAAAGKDKYFVDDTSPESKLPPIEPEDAKTNDGSFTVTLTVRCDMILDNMDTLNKEKRDLVPADGVIFPVTTVIAYDGESVFNVLAREMKRAGIHMSFRNTPVLKSTYIEDINNIYEFDAGELSGWMYCVNGWYPNYGSSRYQIAPGDMIEWHYTCDLGRDLGQLWVTGGLADD
jgi:hypothetical protein